MTLHEIYFKEFTCQLPSEAMAKWCLGEKIIKRQRKKKLRRRRVSMAYNNIKCQLVFLLIKKKKLVTLIADVKHPQNFIFSKQVGNNVGCS